MTEEARKKRILLTGAAGRIGTAFRRYVGDRYYLRLGIHNNWPEDPGNHEVFRMELASLDSCQEACKGMDMVVHLAANPSPRVPFYDDLLDANIKGAYNIFRAAKDQGCQRVIFASSVQAIDGYPLDVQVHSDSPVCPASIYGATKCFGEALARYYACKEGMSCIAVRIGSFDTVRMRDFVNPHRLSKYITQRDMSELLVRCIEAPLSVRFLIAHGVSDNRFKRMDLTETREVLGYEPQDDAFELFGVSFPQVDPESWRK